MKSMRLEWATSNKLKYNCLEPDGFADIIPTILCMKTKAASYSFNANELFQKRHFVKLDKNDICIQFFLLP